MTTNPYAIRVRSNSSLATIGEVDDFAHLSVMGRFNAVGAFELMVRADAAQAANLAIGNGIVLLRDDGDPSGPRTMFSGPIRHVGRTGVENMLSVFGPDDLVALNDRIALPPSGLAYDTRTGVAETQLLGYVNANVVAPTDGTRANAQVSLASDNARGASLTGNARYDKLVASDGNGLLQVLARVGGLGGTELGFRVVQLGTALQFQVYQPVDRSALVKFSKDLGNLYDYSYELQAPLCNAVYVLGGGDLAARTIVLRTDAGSITTYGRIEDSLDRRDTSDMPTLQQAGDDFLAQNGAVTNLSLQAVDTTQTRYLRDYALGDKVTVEIDATQIADVVREVQLQLTPEAADVVSPAIGTQNNAHVNSLLDGFYREVRRMRTRVAQLEGRK